MPNNILIIPGSASIQFSGSAANTIRMQVEQSGSVAFYGNSGSLFSIVDQMSGSLMSVNDVSGLPILEVFSDQRVVMGAFNQNTLVVTGSRVGIDKANPQADLDVSGSVFITGSLRVSAGITGSIASASFASTASFALNAGAGSGFPFSGSAIITGSLLISGSGTSFQVSGSASVRDNFTVNGSTLFVDAVNNRVGIGTLVPATTLQVQGNVSASAFTGSLFGTSSWASTAITSSFATTASQAISTVSSSYAITSSQAINSNAALYSVTASWAANLASEIQRSIKTVEYFDTLTTFNGVRRWWANTNFTIDKVSAFLIDPPQGASVNLRFNKNGSEVSTLSIPAGSTYISGSPFIVMNTQDYLTVDITQVGTTQAGGYLTLVFEYQ